MDSGMSIFRNSRNCNGVATACGTRRSGRAPLGPDTRLTPALLLAASFAVPFPPRRRPRGHRSRRRRCCGGPEALASGTGSFAEVYSGSAFLDASGNALGTRSTVSATGSNGVGNLAQEFAYARSHGFRSLTLVEGTEAFSPLV